MRTAFHRFRTIDVRRFTGTRGHRNEPRGRQNEGNAGTMGTPELRSPFLSNRRGSLTFAYERQQRLHVRSGGRSQCAQFEFVLLCASSTSHYCISFGVPCTQPPYRF